MEATGTGTEEAPHEGRPPRKRSFPFLPLAPAALFFVISGGLIGLNRWVEKVDAKESWRSDLPGLAESVHGFLLEFHEWYGRFPTDVIPESEIKTPDDFIQDGTSNSLLGQLCFPSNEGMIEISFRHLGIDGKYHNPDWVVKPGNRILETGECGYSYVSGLTLNSPPKTPLLLFPMIPGTHRFHPGPLDGKALIVTVDGSQYFFDIGKDGRVAELDAKLNDSIKAGTPLDIRHPRQ